MFERYDARLAGAQKLEQRFRAPTRVGRFPPLSRSAKAIRYPRPSCRATSPQPFTPDAAIQAVLIEVYRTQAATGELCERLVDLDEGLQEWRYRHVKMVERTIGAKMGTGGSSGAAYLLTTLNRPVFPDLWAIRSQL